jgi:hypothetical protein
MNTTRENTRLYAPQVAELMQMGVNVFAYIRPLTRKEARMFFPTAPPDLPEDLQYFALLTADGKPLMLTDTREAAASHAYSMGLEIAMLQ